MNTMTTTRTTATPGVSSENREAWLDQRRQGCTATEVAKLAKGRSNDRRAIIVEKLTGERADLSGNQYVNHGNVREPIIAAWIETNFDIAPSAVLFSGVDPRHLATPDGVSNTFDLDRITSEIKTSKHDLDPRLTYYASTGYSDQMQWQMHVMGGERVLFAWEQHDDNWPDPAPLLAEPRWVWIERDQKRIDTLVAIADDLLHDLDHARPDDLAPVGDIPADLAQLVHDLLQHRDREAVAKKQKEATWKLLQAAMAGQTDYRAANLEATLTVGTVTKDVETLDVEKMVKRAPRVVANYEALVKKCTVIVPGQPKTTMTVTAAKK